MKLLIKDYLNARKQPDTSITAPYYREPGYVLDVDDIAVNGTEINGNPIWYHYAGDGCWYWSGGVDFTNELFTVRALTPEEKLIVYGAAVAELATRYTHIPGFKGLAAGLKRKAGMIVDTPALIFYVDEKLPGAGAVPPVIHYRGIALDTDVHALGEVRLTGNGVILADRLAPYAMGGSLSDSTTGNKVWGTRTLMVKRGKEDYLLACYHVACHSLFAKKQYTLGKSVVNNVYPSPFRSPGRSISGAKVHMGAFDTTCDFALLRVDDLNAIVNVLPSDRFDGWYTTDEIASGALNNIVLWGYGAASEAFSGKLVAYRSGSVQVDTALQLNMTGLIETERMGTNGDSGAPVINLANKKLVGYLVAVGPNSTFLMPFGTLVKDYSIIPKK